MFYTSSTICFIQGTPLWLQGRSRSVEPWACSRRPPRSMSIVGTEFKGCVMHMQDYPDAHEIQPLTVSDYHVLIEAGCLDDYRVELLNGFLVKMHSQSVEHIATVSFLFRTLFKALENRAVIRDSKPITLMKLKSEPEPDIVIASGVDDDYNTRKPSPSDVLLVVEVSNSTLKKDSTIKLEDYALAGIPEYWIVDIKARNVQVLRKPQGNCYKSKKTVSSGFIAPAAFPDVSIRVQSLFRS